MTGESPLDDPDVDPPLRLCTHERCADPCPQIRDRIDGCDEFEFDGMWGTFVETDDGERIAEGHEGVRIVLEAVLGGDPPGTWDCHNWDCDAEPTHTVEFDASRYLNTVRSCEECAAQERQDGRVVYEGVDIEPCAAERCFTAVHASREYCPSHEDED